MFFGKVLGTIWATKKYSTLTGQKMQLIQPLNSQMKEFGNPLVAVDTIGAGPGETVLYMTMSEAALALDVEHAPVDASIIGIIDSINSEIT